MSSQPTQKPRKQLSLSRDTLRVLEDQAAVKFGPQTSERRACCGDEVLTVAAQPSF